MKQDPFCDRDIQVLIPELGTGTKSITFLNWLIEENAYVIPGERIAEILVDNVVFHLDSPAEGKVVALQVKSGEPIQVGDCVAHVSSGQ